MVCAALAGAAASFPAAVAADVPYTPETPIGVHSYVPAAPWYAGTPEFLGEHTSPGLTRYPLTVSPTAAPTDYRKGDWKAAVLLVEYSDTKHRIANTQTLYDAKVNGNGTSDTSLRTFYYETSYGNYTIAGTVSAWVTLPNTRSYYSTHTSQYVVDAVRGADTAGFDYSQIDVNNDGWVDNLIIVHAGNDAAASGDDNDIWSHSGGVGRFSVDGKWVSGYCTVAEFPGAGAYAGDPIGVMMHEFGHHGVGLPDLYDTQYDNTGLGDWDIMAGGAWQGYGNNVAHFSAWSKFYLGWIDPYEPVGIVDYTIYPSSDFQRANPVLITTNYTNEYFLIEFRSTSGDSRYDTYLPYSGLVIYHVDSQVIANTWENNCNCVMYDTAHKGIDIEEVGTQDMDTSPWHSGSGWAANDVWVNSNAGFTPSSTPNSNLYIGNQVSNIRVFNISGLQSQGGVPFMTISIDSGKLDFELTGRIIGPPQQEVLPGGVAHYLVEFRTMSLAGDTVTLSVDGPNLAQGSLDRSSMVLSSLGTGTVNLTVAVPASWSSNDAASVLVRGVSGTSGNAYGVPTITFAAHTYGLDYSGDLNFTITPGVDDFRVLTVHNLGNGPDNVTVTPSFDYALIIASVEYQPGVIGRAASTDVTINFSVATSILQGTVIPVTYEIQYGPSSAPLFLTTTGTITVGKYADIDLQYGPGPLNFLVPDEGDLVHLTLQNYGNYAATVDLSATAPVGVTVVYDAPTVTVPPFSNLAITATVTAGHFTPAGTAGDVWFSATITDLLDTDATSMAVEVTQRFELALTGDTSFEAQPGGHALFNLVATNLGNGLDSTTVSFAPAFTDWDANLTKTSIQLYTSLSTRTAYFEFLVTVPANAPGNLAQTFTVTLRSQQPAVSLSLPVRILVLPVYSFSVDVAPSQGPISSSESASFIVNFHNLGNVRDSYSVTLADLPDDWTSEFADGGIATVDPTMVSQLTLIVKPPATAPADRFEFQLFASSEGNLARATVVALNVTIVPHREIQLTATPINGEVLPGATVTVNIIVKNLGNVNENVFLTPTGQYQSMLIDPVQITVPAYQERVVTATVTLKNDQTAGASTLIVNAAAVNDPTVAAESVIGLQVAKVEPPASTLPGPEGVGAVVALLAVAAVAGMSRRKRD